MTPVPFNQGTDRKHVVLRAGTPGRVKVAIVAGVVLVPLALVGLILRSPMMLLVAAAGLVGLAALVAPAVTRARRWHPPELMLPDESVQLGAELTPLFRLRARRPRDVPSAPVEARLRCQERATYRVGTDTRTVTAEVVEVVATVDGHPSAEGFEARLRLQVPIDAGAPTLRLPNNRVLWTLSVRILGGGPLPGEERTFPLEVAPVVVPHLRITPGIDDRTGR